VAGALIRAQDVAALQLSCQAQADAVTAKCTVTNLPLGRKLPLDFAVRIGAGTEANCNNQTDYATHLTTGQCTLNTAGLSGSQPIAVKLGSSAWQTTSYNAELRPLAITTVSPANVITAGGTPITLLGWGFAVAQSGYSRVITVTNTSNNPLYVYPTLVKVDTASLIAAKKLRDDCGDLRLHDEYGPLNYWLQDGCNTAATELWVNLPHVPRGTGVVTLTYGDAQLTSRSSGAETFLFFDDFNDGVLDAHWTVPTGDFYKQTETGGQLRITGQTNSSNQYNPVGFTLNLWQLTLPDSLAIDSELSVVAGSNNFKASLGTELNLQGGKNIAYWNGSWNTVGQSSVTNATFEQHKFSMGITPSQIRWTENNDLNNVLGSMTVNKPSLGAFTYGPDAVTAFDARFDNIRLRPYAFPEPTTVVGDEGASSGVTVLIGGLPCTNVMFSNATQLTCLAPPHASGSVDVTVINPNGQQTILANGLVYQGQVATRAVYLPVLRR
jgi:hypothetical protein